MFTNSLADGLTVRPSNNRDNTFLQQLHRECRPDLQLIDDEREVVEAIIELQFSAQRQGYGNQYPNAMYFIVEKQNEPIGRVALNFTENEVRLIDIAFITAARGKGYGVTVMQNLKLAAAKVHAPLTLSVLAHNLRAKRLYYDLGFKVTQIQPPYELMAWHPKINRG